MEDEARSTGSREAKRIQKSYFDVLGICCPSEVPLIQRILKPMDGIQKVSVIVPSKTVIVEHDASIVSQLQIVKALNQARLEATIRAYGTDKIIVKWPSPYILACGILLVVSLFQRFFHPLKWLAVAAVAVGLPPIVLRSIAAIRRYTLDINILMLIAVGGALALRDFSEAGFIVFLFTVAEWLETRASHKATVGMSALMSMAPQKAILAETGQVVDARDVPVNTILAVKAGEVIPIDGVVIEGKSEVNEQSLTGESFPVAKQAQSLVWAGTLNIDGYISVKTSALAEHSAVAKMARLVEEAQNSRSKTQRLIDSCAKYYTPATVVIAGGVAVIPLMLRVHNPKHWFQLALVLLVSACPCALVLSTPVATFCALLKAARIGVLVKGGDILEALAKTKVVAFDKTGTITRGEFTVVELQPVHREATMETLLYWISSIESKSSHPMASALVDHSRSKSIEPKPDNVSEFQIYPGEGVYGEIDNKQVYIGNKRIATRAGCVSEPNLEGEGMKEAVTLGYVFSGATLIGTFSLSDSCRTGAAEAMQELKSLGVKIAMLTGDSTAAAVHANNQLGQVIEIVHAGLLPEDKVRIVNELKTKEGPTAMVGDGMNDAPALAAANVGISMGISGSAVAMETSHITLMSNDILRIPKAIRLAKKTHHKIIVNILFSVTTKVAILALAVAGHPLLWAAVLADVGTCLIVILNSMLLLHTNNSKAKKKFCSSHKSDVHKHAQCGAVHCSGSGEREHGHSHGHGDQCSKKDSCQSQDTVHSCGETGHVKRKSRKHAVTNGCRMEHHGKVAHDGLKSECHGDHQDVDVHAHQKSHGDCSNESGADGHGHHAHGAHVHCEGDHHHHDDDEHIQLSNHVDCCEGSEAGIHVHHGHDAHVHCGAAHHDDESILEHTNHVDCCNGSESNNEGDNARTHCGTGHDIYASHQHVISVAGEAHDRRSGKSVAYDHRINVVKHCSDVHAQKKESAVCCKTERKECEKEVCCSSPVQVDFERQEIGGCHKVEECLVRACCTSYTHGGLRRREIGKCCRSYRMECGKRERCCAGGMVRLPEIIIE